LHLAASGNRYGYGIASQNYFEEALKQHNSASASSLCEARQKISWEAFAFLLEQASQHANAPRWKGHQVFSTDGTRLSLPASNDVLAVFPRTELNQTHYPKANLVTAVNAFTHQPVTARIDRDRTSERELFVTMLGEFNTGDIHLIDRGFSGLKTWQSILDYNQHFVCRVSTGGGNVTNELMDFLGSCRKDAIITWADGRGKTLKVRVVLCGKDRHGLAIVIATSLTNKEKYSRKEIIQLYHRRWRHETFYFRLKRQTHIENFHAKSVNGVLQEIFAHLLVLSWAALLIWQAQIKLGVNSESNRQPNFKNAIHLLRRSFAIFFLKSKAAFRKAIELVVDKVIRQILWRQPGRQNPRVSKRPKTTWSKGGKNRACDRARRSASRGKIAA
jgi:hypothetical protein